LVQFLGDAGSVPGVFALPTDFDVIGSAFSARRLRTYGPFPYKIPPPDKIGIWFPIGEYGVTFRKAKLDFFDKHRTKRKWKRAFHGKITGTLMCQTDLSDFGPVDGVMCLEDSKISKSLRSFRHGPDRTYLSRLSEKIPQDEYVQPLTSDDVTVGTVYATQEQLEDIIETGDMWKYPHVEYTLEKDSTSFSAPATFKKLNIVEFHDLSHEKPRESGNLGLNNFNRGSTYQVEVTAKEIRRLDQALCELRVSVKVNVSSIVGLNNPQADEIEYDTIVRLHIGAKTFDVPENPGRLFSGIFKAHCRQVESYLSGRPMRLMSRKVRTKALIDIAGLDMNNLENITGLTGAAGILKNIVTAYKAFKNFNFPGMLKAFADGWLILQFAIKPAVGDVDKIRKDGKKVVGYLNREAARHRRRATEVTSDFSTPYSKSLEIKVSSLYHLERNIDWESRIIDALDTIGLAPSPGNLWELVPFSFVIDWFTNLGSVLQATRFERDTWHYTLLVRIESKKYEYEVSRNGINLMFGDQWKPIDPLKVTIYRRNIMGSWGSTDPLLLAGGFDGLSANQWFSSGALVIQKAIG